jgi:hypothetical protein
MVRQGESGIGHAGLVARRIDHGHAFNDPNHDFPDSGGRDRGGRRRARANPGTALGAAETGAGVDRSLARGSYESVPQLVFTIK